MADVSEQKIQQQGEALRHVDNIVLAFHVATKSQKGGYSSAIGSSGYRVFRDLSKERGIFARPVSFRRDKLCEDVGITSGTLGRAMKRLIGHGFLTVSGSRTAPSAMLHLPAHAIAAYEHQQQESAKDFWGWVDQTDLEESLAVLDEPEFAGYAERHRLGCKKFFAALMAGIDASD